MFGWVALSPCTKQDWLKGGRVRSLNESAATQAIRRLCTPSVKTGKAKVSAELVKKFTGGGGGRKELVMLWMKCGGDIEPLFQHL